MKRLAVVAAFGMGLVSAAFADAPPTHYDITPLTNVPSGSGTWQGQLKCFLGNNGIILSACNTNDTSEYSNVVAVAGGDVIFATGIDL